MKKIIITLSLLLTFNSYNHNVTIGTPLTKTATKVLLCGSGELGKELAIELQRLGIEVVALDRYDNAPAMQVAHKSYTLPMLDGDALRTIIEKEQPDFIVPEIEAIATNTLVELEKEGFNVIPTAQATVITMNRKKIRQLAVETLGLKTSPYRFASAEDEYYKAVEDIGLPCVVKPVMSSSGRGQTIIKTKDQVDRAWNYAQTNARAATDDVIIEGFVDFDYEITLLTIRHKNGTSYCQPIGHRQVNGDYRESWQPHSMPDKALKDAQEMAKKVTDALGGYGVFGVEFFVKGDTVYFNELSPRPHDTGMVTLISQDLSEFALHARAILGLSIPTITQYGPAASHALVVDGTSDQVTFGDINKALELPQTQIRLFGKPKLNGHRRMGVSLAMGTTIEDARKKAADSISKITITF